MTAQSTGSERPTSKAVSSKLEKDAGHCLQLKDPLKTVAILPTRAQRPRGVKIGAIGR